MADEEDRSDAATEAFEQLRGEVAQLRDAIEILIGRTGEPASDYALTLGAIAKTLAQIEAHPALRYSPHHFGAETSVALESVRGRFETEIQRALTSISAASGEIRRHAKELRTREAQRQAVGYSVAGGLVAGALLWIIISGPTARALPASWRIPQRMAAATLHQDMWAAGSRLMETSDPSEWNKIVAARRLFHDNASTLKACDKAASKAGRAQLCKIVILQGG